MLPDVNSTDPLASSASAALVLCLSGPQAAADRKALESLREQQPGIRVYAICLDGAPPIETGVFDRVVKLPLGREHLGHAESIGLQLAFNERSQFVGIAHGLTSEDIAAAGYCFDALSAGRSDVIVIPEPDAQQTRIFLSHRAAFLASFWSALAEAFSTSRIRLTSVLLKLAGRCGTELTRAGLKFGLLELQQVDIRDFLPHAREMGRRLGIDMNGQLSAKVKPVRRVAVVTPYYKEPDSEIARAMGSVMSQSATCHHIMVSDGFPNALAVHPGVTHIELGVSHADNGNTPRYVGAMVALAKGYDAIAFLDADNWFERKHVQRLVERQNESLAAAVFSFRNIYLSDGFKLPQLDGEDGRNRHVDTSCYLLTRGCEYAIHLWGQMPQEWGPVCDRVMFSELQGVRVAWTGNRTMNFKSNYAVHYRMAQRPVPEKVNDIPRNLWRDFIRQSADFRQRSVSRTGRVIAIKH